MNVLKSISVGRAADMKHLLLNVTSKEEYWKLFGLHPLQDITKQRISRSGW